MAIFLNTADLHLTANTRDEYRWSIFDWIVTQAKARGVDGINILGDITDEKNDHPSVLVNRIVDQILRLAEICPVRILKGNHDYQDNENEPFFDFLNEYRNVEFISSPKVHEIQNTPGFKMVWLPHTRQLSYHHQFRLETFPNLTNALVLFHQCLDGIKSVDGHVVQSGVSSANFSDLAPGCDILGGDIHNHQRCGRAIYCGSPHWVHFNEHRGRHPRVVFYDTTQPAGERLNFVQRATVRKVTIEVDSIRDLRISEDFDAGDYVKVRYRLSRSCYSDWPAIQKEIKEFMEGRRLYLSGLEVIEPPTIRKSLDDDNPVEVVTMKSSTPSDILNTYAIRQGINKVELETGKKILSEVE